jgi:release factor glutamine methyltransferase
MEHQSKYDLIISNPPYISLEEIDGLDSEVLLYDPLNALTDYDDGLSFYKYFAEHGRDLLNPNGTMLFEFGGEYQSQKITKLFSQAGYHYKLFNDLNNEPRFICVRL